MIFVYDRIENGTPVPNGYPRNFEYKDNPNDYFQKFQKEKTVHKMFDYSIGYKHSDEVDKDFIYPVHQFGAVEKMIGYEKTS